MAQNKVWSSWQTAYLDELMTKGMSVKQASLLLGKTTQQIKNKLYQMNKRYYVKGG